MMAELKLPKKRLAVALPPENKRRARGKEPITISRNEILYGLNQADKFILAIVLVDEDSHEEPFFVRKPFK